MISEDRPLINIGMAIKNIGNSVALDIQSRIIALRESETVDDLRNRIIPDIAKTISALEHHSVVLFAGPNVTYRAHDSVPRDINVTRPNVRIHFAPVVFYRTPFDDKVYWTAAKISCSAGPDWVDLSDETCSLFKAGAVITRSKEVDLAV
jgi:hypothetical protein